MSILVKMKKQYEISNIAIEYLLVKSWFGSGDKYQQRQTHFKIF